MKVGDKVMAEGIVAAIGAGFYRIQFGRVGTQAVTHVRVASENVQPVKAPKKAASAD